MIQIYFFTGLRRSQSLRRLCQRVADGLSKRVVNLAPASQSDSAETQSLDEIPRNDGW